MRTRRGARRGSLYAFALLLAGTALATAFDTPDGRTGTKAPLAQTEPVAETRRAVGAYRDGRKIDAADIFAQAAARGHVPAQWKLARMLAEGDGIEPDVARAAALYTAIAERFADRDPGLRIVPFVAYATREAGRMQLEGDAGPRAIKVARRHLWRAATTYRDAQARYLLGRSLLNVDHGAPQPETALAWLHSAVARGHAGAGVMLGEMQIAGRGTKRDPIAGLLAMARGVERAEQGERASLALRFQAARASVDDAYRVGIDAEMARLGLTAAGEPVMNAEAGE